MGLSCQLAAIDNVEKELLCVLVYNKVFGYKFVLIER